jgi:multicomponent Na+:H+ antiporter subunit D
MSWYLSLPLMLPFLTAVLVFLVRNDPAGRWVSVGGSLAATVCALLLFFQVEAAGVVAGQMGGWAAPFGITLVADRLSGALVLITAITGLAVAVFATAEIDPGMERMGYHSLFQILLGGVTGAFLTGDLFNLYVWFEVMLISSFGLLILGGKPEQIDGAVKYVTLNLIATILFLAGIGMLYGLTGTLNMADLHLATVASDKAGLLPVVALLFVIAFGMKAAVFPLFFWLPAAYHTPAFTVSAIFAALLTKVGVYSLFRCFTLIFPDDGGFTDGLLLWVAALTMLVGAFGALAQNEIRKVLSFQIISSIGFLLLGLALDSALAMTGALFYLFHNILVKANLFLCAGVVDRLTGSCELDKIGGLYRCAPLFSALFLIPAFSLGGFPPLSGFWAKFLLVKASLDLEAWLIAAVVLTAGLLTIFSMMRVWAMAFWTPHPDNVEPWGRNLGAARLPMLLPIAGLGALTVLIGLVPEPVILFSESAAAQLLQPTAYVEAVLGVQE